MQVGQRDARAVLPCASSCLTRALPRTFLEPLGIIDLVATQLLTRIMNSHLAKPMPDQDRFLRRFIQVRAACGGLRRACVCVQECMRVYESVVARFGLAAARQCRLQPSYCTTAGAEIAAFEPGVETVSLCLAFLCASISSAIVTVS